MLETDLWANLGGDFAGEASARIIVGGIGSYTWGPTPEMTADVQRWLDDPTANFGWLLLGDESGIRTSKRFDSRENPTGDHHPTLTIIYTPAS